MANEDTKLLFESCPMNDGENPCSYAQNSSRQKGGVDATKNMIADAIVEKLDINTSSFDSSNPFRIADLGCSTGPNTFIAVQNIIEAVELKYNSIQQNPKVPEFQVFFNDHTNNDFNTLFRNLPPSRLYFAAGVPSSFYARSFPKSTIHFAHSSYALHWLSKLPKEVVDSNSHAFNKAHICCTGTVKEVAEAFSAQYHKDIEAFLSARAQELVGGGLMVILLPGLPDGLLHIQTSSGMMKELLGSCLRDMAKKGLFAEEKVDSFNLPLYLPSPKELQALIERNRYFSIEKMEILSDHLRQMTFTAQMVSSHTRAITEALVEEHFGKEIVEELFKNFEKKLAESSFIFKEENLKNIDLFILLKRKNIDLE